MDLTLLDALQRHAVRRRRLALMERLGDRAALIASSLPRPRCYAGATYPFRASSHFLYLAGVAEPDAYLLLADGASTLFVHDHDAAHALWHGPGPSRDEIAEAVGCAVRPLQELDSALAGLDAMTLPTPDLAGCAALSARLGRPVAPGELAEADLPLADAMIALRLVHDAAAQACLRRAAEVAGRAFAAGAALVAPGGSERAVRAAMEAVANGEAAGMSFAPIVSVQGEVLHNEAQRNRLGAGELLLVDFGVEEEHGFASDVTRTWPVSGRYSPTQRAMVEVVLAAQAAAIDAVRPGARYRDVHLAAARAVAAGLVALGVLRGDVEELVADGVHALFFPHGVGHLLGLDVHDMEDLGDRAGYAAGRTRSPQFGLGYLRLDRDLVPGMAVTIEPGFYQVPAILNDTAFTAIAGDRLDRAELARFSDVRGIRIEDDVLVTSDGHEVLTAAIPRTVAAMEAAIHGA